MRFLKWININIIVIITTVLVIFLNLPAKLTHGEGTYGGEKCCGNVEPAPECNSIPTKHCSLVRDKCLTGDYCRGFCSPCVGDGAHPCMSDPVNCLNQPCEECEFE